MARTDKKATRAAHVKKATRGTSNEISFDVLDVLRESLDLSRDRLKGHEVLPGDISLFTLPKARRSQVAGSVQSLEEKAHRRKSHRRLSKVSIFLVAIIAAVFLLVGGGKGIYSTLQHQQDGISLLNEVLFLVDGADKTILLLDDLVADPFAQKETIDYDAIKKDIQKAQSTLHQADKMARDASAKLCNSYEKNVANQTQKAISARQELLNIDIDLLCAIEDANVATMLVDGAWEKILAADNLARSAAALVHNTTVENVEESKEKTDEATALLNEVHTMLSDAQLSCPAADLAPLLEYVDKRLEALSFAAASDDAFLAKDPDGALSNNDAYNKADAEAATLAKDLSEDPSAVIAEAYEQTTKDMMSAYVTTRSQVSSTDAFIRNYLGIKTK